MQCKVEENASCVTKGAGTRRGQPDLTTLLYTPPQTSEIVVERYRRQKVVEK